MSVKTIKSLVAFASGLAALIAVSHASAETAQAPQAETRPIAVVYSDQGPSGVSDVAMGAYRVPGSNLIISGYQKGGALGLLLGPVGLVAQSAVNSGAAKESVSNTGDALRIDIAQQAVKVTQTALASDRYAQTFTATAHPGGPTLTVIPYVVVTFKTDTDVRPYVFLKAKLNNGGPSDASRSTRYICCIGPALPLTGESGLTANGGEPFRKMVEQELEAAVKLMLDDVNSPYVRDKSKLTHIEAPFPFGRTRLKLKGYILSEDPNSVIVDLPGIFVFTGVEMMDKSEVSYTTGR